MAVHYRPGARVPCSGSLSSLDQPAVDDLLLRGSLEAVLRMAEGMFPSGMAPLTDSS